MSLHLTMIGRATDGLPLCVSVSNEQTTSDFERQGKLFFKKIKSNSPTEGTLQAKNNFSFHYAIRNKVCYLVLTDSSFPKRVAFSYLDDIASEFFVQFGARTDNVVRPYAFIEFDTYIQKSKKTFSDLRNRNQILHTMSGELRDVQKVMMGNMEDVLLRGQSLKNLADNSSRLNQFSSQYQKQAKQLNRNSYLLVGGAVGGGMLLLFFLIKLLF